MFLPIYSILKNTQHSINVQKPFTHLLNTERTPTFSKCVNSFFCVLTLLVHVGFPPTFNKWVKCFYHHQKVVISVFSCPFVDGWKSALPASQKKVKLSNKVSPGSLIVTATGGGKKEHVENKQNYIKWHYWREPPCRTGSKTTLRLISCDKTISGIVFFNAPYEARQYQQTLNSFIHSARPETPVCFPNTRTQVIFRLN